MNISSQLSHSSIHQAINNGKNHLLDACTNSKWTGFPTLAGTSDIWVTGFVVTHIQSLCQEHFNIRAAHNFLIEARQLSHGWSYSSIVPSDADSTAWCIMALQEGDQLSEEALNQSKAFLWSHINGKGIATYKIASGIGQFISAPNDAAIAGWTSAHPDVSVAAVLADASNKNASKMLNWLYSLINEDGFVESYWWRSPLYTTTLMLRAMQNANLEIPENIANKVLKELVNIQLTHGGFAVPNEEQFDAFSTALALEAFVRLSDYAEYEQINSCAKALIKAQNTSGNWDGNFILRIPAPHVIDPKTVNAYDNPDGGGNSFIPDQGGLFATAMSCYALNLYSSTFLENTSNPEEV